MTGRKILVLLLLLGFGGVVETAWTVRGELGLGAAGCRVLGGRFYGPSFAFEREESLTVPEGATVEVENAFGAVDVWPGEPGRVQVRLRSVVYLPLEEQAREFSRDVELVSSLEDGTLRIGTNRRRLDRRSVGLETHLSVAVPPSTEVRVRNEHGRVDVRDAAAADVETSYDSVDLAGVAGEVRVRSRHGRVSIVRAGGPVGVSGRHGDVEVSEVTGQTSLEVSHGDVQASRLGSLKADLGWGSLTVEHVRGDVEVDAKHVGVRVSDVEGGVRVETSYRDVEVERVGADAHLTAHHGDVSAASVRGGLTVRAGFGGVRLRSVAGDVEIAVDHGGVEAQELQGSVRVEASGDDVVLEGFRGPVHVENRRGGARLVPMGALEQAVTATTAHGGIQLEVPPGSRFDLAASTSRGEVRVDVPGFDAGEMGSRRATGRVGGGGALVTLSADPGDVELTGAGAVARRDE